MDDFLIKRYRSSRWRRGISALIVNMLMMRSLCRLPGKLLMRGRTMQTLVDFLSIRAYAGGRVLDGTGITGPVDVDLEWTVDWSDMLIANANLATAVQEQLGLKLESRRPPTPVLVIEQMQRPSSN